MLFYVQPNQPLLKSEQILQRTEKIFKKTKKKKKTAKNLDASRHGWEA
jgi:hypothetical protein